MTDLVMKIKRSEYLEMKRVQTILAQENEAWIEENPIDICYILATPTEENISLPPLHTFKDTTIMSVDTTVLPSNIKVTYVRT